MAQIIKDDDIGSSMGRYMGNRLSQGLDRLAQYKLNDIIQRQERNRVAEAIRSGNIPETPDWYAKTYYQNFPEQMPKAQQGMTQQGINPQEMQRLMQEQRAIQEQQGMLEQLNSTLAPQFPMNAGQQVGNALNGRMGIGMPAVGEGTRVLQKMNAPRPQAPMQQAQPPMQPRTQPNQYGTDYVPLTRKEKADYWKKMVDKDYKDQKAILVDTKAYRDDLDKQYTEAKELRGIIDDAIALINTGKTRSDISGYAPLWGANWETRELEKKLKDIVVKRAALLRGPTTNAKLFATEATKASLNMPKKAQLDILMDNRRILEEGPLARKRIATEIKRRNGGKVPADFSDQIEAEVDRLFPYKNPNSPQGMAKMKEEANRTENKDDANPFEYLARLGTGAAGRFGYGAGTGYANLASAGMGLGHYFSGGRIPRYEDTKIPLPTSADMEKKFSKLTNGWSDPRTPFEEALYNTFETLGSIMAPGAALGAIGNAAVKAGTNVDKILKWGKILMPFSGTVVPLKTGLKIAAGGEVADQALKAVGADPVVRAIGKTMTMVGLGTAGTRGKVEANAKANYEKAKAEFKLDTTDVSSTLKDIKNFRNKVTGTAHPHQEKMLEIVDEVEKGLSQYPKIYVNSGAQEAQYHVPVNDLIDMKQGLNTRFKWSSHPKTPGSKEYTPWDMRENLGELIDILKKPIAKAGEKNPAGGIPFTLAEDATKALNTYTKTTKWLMQNADLSHKFSGYGPAHTVFTLIKGGIGKGLKDTFKVRSLWKTPAGRQAYIDALTAAEKQNRNALIQALTRIEKLG